jgi:two-component system, NtrC family, sensor kinase
MPVSDRELQSDKDLAESGLYDVDYGRTRARGAHIRHSVAKWLPGLTLSARLSLFVALIVIGVVASVTYLETRSFERDIDRELMDAARLGAQSAADNVAAREPPLDPLDIRDVLHDLVEADPVLDVISVIEVDDAGQRRVFSSTSTEERAEVMDIAVRAVATRASTSDRNSTVAMLAVPVPRRGHYAVVVTVGLESLLGARDHALRVALGFALPTILLVTILAHFTVRYLVGRPLASILRTMEETADGDLSSRTPIARRDELGAIATRLNGMLDQLERFNRSLHERIEEATRDLSLRNTQLAASQNQLLAVRESLARAERVAALGQVAANVAHQAGTPLNLVSGYVQMIRDDPRTDDRVRSRLQTIDTQIQHVTRVLRTMLDYARQPSGFETVSFADIIERVGDLVQPRLSRAGVRPRISIAPGLPHIRADVTQLEMALLNLVTNALDAMPQGGTLSVAAYPTPEGIRLEIADTGTGIPAQIFDRLFEPWVTTKPAGQGTGLGLAIVREVVRAHGGSISAHNQADGAVFVIDLPAAASAETSA